MGDYVQLADLRHNWVGIGDSYDDALLDLAITTAENEVDVYCGRRFTLDTLASTRWVDTYHYDRVILPGWDIASTTGLVVATDPGFDGTAETVWTITTDYRLEPRGGIGPDGRPGWPYTTIRNVRSSRWFPTGTHGVSITALWGWPAIPPNVKTATMILAAEILKLKDAPLGVAGFGDLGLIRVRDNPVVARLLSRYVHPYTAAVLA